MPTSAAARPARRSARSPARSLGAVVPGVSTVDGRDRRRYRRCVLGAVINNRQYYRDTRGYCYYVDQYGRPVYDYNVRC